MTRKPTDREIAEVLSLIEVSGKSLISRGYIVDIIEATPEEYPALARYDERIRADIVSQIMNQRFNLRNQTAKKPRSRVWVINQQTGVQCASC